MASPDVELANAIVADINSADRSWSQFLEAERTWVPLWIGKDQLSDLQCIVNPWPVVEVEPESRDFTLSHYSIDFGFAKRLDDKTEKEIDDLRQLVDSVYRRYVVTNFTVANIGVFIPLRRLDEYITYDPSRIQNNKDGNQTYYTGDFLSIFRIPYRLQESY